MFEEVDMQRNKKITEDTAFPPDDPGSKASNCLSLQSLWPSTMELLDMPETHKLIGVLKFPVKLQGTVSMGSKTLHLEMVDAPLLSLFHYTLKT